MIIFSAGIATGFFLACALIVAVGAYLFRKVRE